MLEKLTLRRLPVYPRPPESPVTTGGRIFTPGGELTQILNGIDVRFVAYVEFAGNLGSPRGNHYHRRRREWLYIVRGRLQAHYEDVESRESMELVLETGDLVCVEPGCAHVYFPLEYTQAIECSSIDFDPQDTRPHVLDVTPPSEAR
jgi:mannose-6-phosphate isomerase-like protein (cupin superfamily)